MQAQTGLAKAEGLLRSARTYWYHEVEMLWDMAVNACQIAPEERAAARIASLTATGNCVAAVDSLYRLAGSSAIFRAWKP